VNLSLIHLKKITLKSNDCPCLYKLIV